MCGQSHSRWPCSGDGRGQLLHHREGQQRPRHSCHECHRPWKRVSGRGPHHHPRAKDSPSGPPGPPPVLSHVLGGGPLGRVSVSAFLSPWWGLPAGRGGAQESELEGTPKAMARSGEVWISGGGSRRLWGHSPRWQHRPEHGAAGSPRVSSRGAASELWPYLVHGSKGSWWGPGQFSARGPGGPGELGGAAAAGTRHPLIGSPGPVLRAGAEGRTDPDGPHTPRPQWRAAPPSAPPRSRVETSRLPLAGQGRRLQRG